MSCTERRLRDNGVDEILAQSSEVKAICGVEEDREPPAGFQEDQ
jgi:hypothetical protein